ncbi:MAG TPA: ABC transporter permease [Thermoplasmata archaeon]|jgi:peptide/nickel transport system permease protein
MVKGSRTTGTAAGAFARFLTRRALLALLVLLGVVIIVFTLSRVIAADPAALWAGPHARPEDIEAARVELHLRDSWPVQFWYYFTGLLRGDLGVSIRTHNPVLGDIADKLPATLELIIASLIIAILVGIPLGVYAGIRRGKLPDHLTRMLAVGGVSIPAFWFAVILQMVFVQVLGILPLQGRFTDSLAISYPMKTITGFLVIDALIQGNLVRFTDSLAHLVLPSITLALYPIGLVARMTRTMMVEALGENYIRTAKAFGIPLRRIYYRYALRNAVSPAIVAVGLSFAYELTGAFLIEQIFGWNGIGQYAFQSVLTSDYPAILGTAIVVALFYVIVNLIVDVMQSFLDPRVVLTRKEA